MASVERKWQLRNVDTGKTYSVALNAFKDFEDLAEALNSKESHEPGTHITFFSEGLRLQSITAMKYAGCGDLTFTRTPQFDVT
jgi:hypothetical protein